MELPVMWTLIGAAIGFALGVTLGAFIMFMLRRLREAKLEAELQVLRDKVSPDAIQDSLRTITGDAITNILNVTQQQFEPLLKQLREHAEGQGALKERMDNLFQTLSDLLNVLKTPITRGHWAEFHLRRLVELAGLREHVDFNLQESLPGGLRPDMVIYLPNNLRIIVDAKAPITAIEATDEDERRKIAKAIKRHIENLSGKEYWRSLENPRLDFVVMYIPNEYILSAATEADDKLLEFAFNSRVLPVTPITFFALLKIVALVWQEQQTLSNAHAIIERSQELFLRMRDFAKNFSKLGEELKQTVEKYNKAVSCFEKQVFPALDGMQRLRGIQEEFNLPKPINEIPEDIKIDA